MPKPRPSPPPQREPGTASAKRGRLPLVARITISVVLVWHLTAVFLAPLSVPPSSALVAAISQQPPMQWYSDALYLNHGYGFFAPDPPPAHQIRYELLDGSGEVVERGEFPNYKEQRPRLLYHRYFMLADQAEQPAPNEQERDYWQRGYLESYARRLLWTHEDAQSARVQRLRHWPLPLALAQEGRRLDDPEGTHVLMEVIQRRSDLGPAATDQGGLWQSGRPNVASPWIGVRR
jgi:hypothetical protein